MSDLHEAAEIVREQIREKKALMDVSAMQVVILEEVLERLAPVQHSRPVIQHDEEPQQFLELHVAEDAPPTEDKPEPSWLKQAIEDARGVSEKYKLYQCSKREAVELFIKSTGSSLSAKTLYNRTSPKILGEELHEELFGQSESVRKSIVKRKRLKWKSTFQSRCLAVAQKIANCVKSEGVSKTKAIKKLMKNKELFGYSAETFMTMSAPSSIGVANYNVLFEGTKYAKHEN